MTSSQGVTVGIIAGTGQLPLVVAEGAREAGCRVVVVAGVEGAFRGGSADAVHAVPLGQWGRVIATLQREKVTKVVAVGDLNRQHFLRPEGLDERFMTVMSRLSDPDNVAMMQAFAADLESCGFAVERQEAYIAGAIARAGVTGASSVSDASWADVRHGWATARAVARLGIGQTVVVKAGAVLAVEAVCGTDNTIRRGGRLGGAGAVAVKVGHPGGERRFDLPVIGPATVEAAVEAGMAVLAFEADRTLLLDGQRCVSLATEGGLSLVAFAPDTEVP